MTKISHSEAIWSIIFISLMFSIAQVSAISLNSTFTSSLRVYYSLDETSGTNVADYLNINNGTNNGATVNVTGILNKAYYFNKSEITDYVLIPDGTVNLTTAPMSISFWIKPNSLDAVQDSHIISGIYPPSGYSLSLGTSGTKRLNFGKLGVDNVDSGIDFITLGAWQMITMVYNSTDVNFYKNGLLNKTAPYSSTFSSSSNYSIGNAPFDAIQQYDGTIDEIGVWNKSLTHSETLGLYYLYAGAPAEQSINLIFPANSSVLASVGSNFTASFNITAPSMNYTWRNATYFIWKNGTLFNSTFITLSENNTQDTTFIDTFSLGDYEWNVYGTFANNTFVNSTWAGLNRTFSVGSTILSQNYSISSYETARETFNISINLLTGTQIALAKLVYGAAEYAVEDIILTAGSNSITAVLSKTIDLPLNSNPFSNQTNIFYWKFTYNGGQVQTLTSQVQNVSFINLQLCNATYNTKSLNFTLFDEANQTNIDLSANPASLQMNFKYWIGSGNVQKNYTVQNLSAITNGISFCTSSNLTYSSNLDSVYSATNYLENRYYLRNATLTDTVNNILLYLLPTSIGQKFYVQVQQGVTFLSGAIVQVSKYFIGLGEYKVTSIQLTDVDGKFPMYMSLDGNYRFNVIKNGVLLGTIDKTASCATAPCSISLIISQAGGSVFDDYNSIYANGTISSLTFNKATKIVTYNFIDLTGLANYFRLEVRGINIQNGSYLVCNVTSYSISGSLTCNMTGYSGDFIAKGYVSRSPEKIDSEAILSFLIDEDVVSNIGLDGLFLVMGLIITLVFAAAAMSKGNPSVVIFVLGISLLALKIIHLLPFSWTIVATLEAVIFYILIKLKV